MRGESRSYLSTARQSRDLNSRSVMSYAVELNHVFIIYFFLQPLQSSHDDGATDENNFFIDGVRYTTTRQPAKTTMAYTSASDHGINRPPNRSQRDR